jgi:hypothetical protein
MSDAMVTVLCGVGIVLAGGWFVPSEMKRSADASSSAAWTRHILTQESGEYRSERRRRSLPRRE